MALEKDRKQTRIARKLMPIFRAPSLSRACAPLLTHAVTDSHESLNPAPPRWTWCSCRLRVSPPFRFPVALPRASSPHIPTSSPLPSPLRSGVGRGPTCEFGSPVSPSTGRTALTAMRWGWVPFTVAVTVSVAAATVAAGFDLSGPDGTGGQPEASGLVVGVASGGEDEPTGALPPGRIFGRVKIVNAWASSSGTLTRLRPNGGFGCSPFGAGRGAGVTADSDRDESRWVVEAVTTPGAEKFVRLRNACAAGGGEGGVYLGRSGGPPNGQGPPSRTAFVGFLDPSGFAQQWSLSRGSNADCTVLTSRWEPETAVLTRDTQSGIANSPAAGVSLQRRNVGWSSQCWTISRA